MSIKREVFQNQKELKKQETFIKENGLEQPVQSIQEIEQKQTNKQSQEQEANISQDVNEEQIQKDFKSLNLHINSDALLPDLTAGILKGIVLQEDTKAPLNNVRVGLFFGTQGRAPVLEVNTNSFGEFKVEDLPAGFYTIKVLKDNYSPKILYNLRVKAGQEVLNEIVLARSRSGAKFQSLNDKNLQDVDQTQINKQNQNQVSTLTQDVTLQQKQIFNPTVNISIIAGGPDLRDLTVGKISGTVLSADSGQPLKEEEVELYFGSHNTIPLERRRTDAEGKYYFADLPAGFYSLRIIGLNRSNKDVLNLRVRPGKELEQDFTL